MKKFLFTISIIIISFSINSQTFTDAGSYSTTTDKIGIGTSQINISGTGVNDLVIGNGAGSRGLIVNAGSGNDAILAFARDGVMQARWQFNSPTSDFFFFRPSTGRQFTIKEDGNIGIGTGDPISKLHVHEAEYLGSNTSSNILLTRISGKTVNTFMNNLWLRRDASGSDWFTARLHDGISVDASYLNPGTNTRTWWERDPYNNIQSWGNASSTYMTIKSGNIGVGTTNTNNGKFTINSSTTKHLLRLESDGAGNEAQLRFRARSSSNQNLHADISLFSTGLNQGYLGFKVPSNNSNNVGFDMIINESGEVGIGTTTPDAKLAVNGTIHTKEVKVDLIGWPDFVFSNDYQLPSLDEVEKFIAQNNHLPEIPSEAEVLEDGINLGEMNAKLLQKIEELTLYLIDQNKEIKSMRSELDELKKGK